MNASPVITECIRLLDEQLASSQREMGDVRAILEDAVARLIRDRSSVTALQFQDISDQLLAHASGRLAWVRAEIGQARESFDVHALHGNLLAHAKREARPVHAADLEPGSIDLF